MFLPKPKASLRLLVSTALSCAMPFVLSEQAVAGPSGGLVVGGSAVIEQAGSTTTIRQSSNRGIIRWNSFDVGASEHVDFQQPSSSSITVNRILDSNASQIDGRITANGNIVLINPNGVLFGGGAQVDVGGLVTSTSDLEDDAAFMAGGALRLTRPGNPDAKIINNGSMTIGEAGLAGFIAPHVENNGVIVARLGKVALASGDISTIDFAGDGLIQIDVSSQVQNQTIKNTGTIQADGGTILLSAATGRNIVESLISNEGVLRARTTASGQKGTIRMNGTGATIQNTGLVDARGSTTEDGGDIDINGSFVSLGGVITADGKNGGTINVIAGTLSLADQISAKGLAGTGGTINLKSQTTWEVSTSSVNASGLLGGGYIRHIAEDQIISSGSYWANSDQGEGGRIDISGWSTKFLSAQMNADGLTGGGTIRLGGPYQGGKDQPLEDFPHAYYLIVDRGTQIRARALGSNGKGGTTILWADQENVTMGTIDVSPGTQSGNGGFVEVSSGDTLKFDADVTTGTPDRPGDLLLDPKNILISDFTFNSSAIILGYGYGGGRTNTGTSLDSGDQFGYAISLDGNRMAVGALADDGLNNAATDTGAVYLFSFQDSSFSGAVLEGIIGYGYTGGKNVDLTPLGNNDWFGSSVSLDGTRLAVGAYGDDGSGNSLTDSGAVYLFTFTDSAFSGGTLAATIGKSYTGGKNINVSALDASDWFGVSVSLDGNRLAVGAHGDNGSSNVLGDSGAVYLFTFTDSVFSGGALAATIGQSYTGGKNYSVTLGGSDYFGRSVALNGTQLAVGAVGDDGFGNTLTDSGAVYLFTFTDSAFSGASLAGTMGYGYTGGKSVNITDIDSGDNYGTSVSLDSNRLAVGTRYDDGPLRNTNSNYGSVRLFTMDNAAYDNLALQSTIGYQYTGDKNMSLEGMGLGGEQFGSSVSLDGNRLIVGSAQDAGASGTLTSSGAVYMFTFSNSTFSSPNLEGIVGSGYTQGKNYNVPGLSDADNSSIGMSVSIDGTKLAIGNYLDDGYGSTKANSGAVYLYSFTDTSYSGGTLEAIIGNGYTGGKNYNQALSVGDNFARSVSLDGNRLAVGAYRNDGYSGVSGDSGAVYLYDFSDSAFSNITLQSTIGYGYTGGKNINISTTLGGGDYFGTSVSLDGTRLAVGAFNDDGSSNTITDAGAVYLFTFTDTAFSGGTLAATIGYGYTGGKNINLTLENNDQFGSAVSLDGTRLAVGALGDDGSGNTISASGAAYLFTFSDTAFSGGTLAARIGNNYTGGKNVTQVLEASDNFGYSVALTGNTLFVGSAFDDGYGNSSTDSGAVYRYNFTDSAFSGGTLAATIGNNYTGINDYDTRGYIFGGDNLGKSLSVDGQNLVIGASGDDGYANNTTDSGAILFFRYTDLTYATPELLGMAGSGYGSSFLGKSIQTNNIGSSDQYGSSVALDGLRMAVGAPRDDGLNNLVSNAGAVYLYTFSDTSYSGGTLQAIIGSGYTGGKNINLTLESNDYFGTSVSLDGTRLAVGAYGDDGSGNSLTDSGAVYLFTFSDSAFLGGTLASTIGKSYTGGKNIHVSALDASDWFGISVSLDGNRLAVGAYGDDGSGNSTADSGGAYIFTFSDSVFSGGALASTIGYGYTGGLNINLNSILSSSDYFGYAVALDGTRLAVSAYGDDGSGNTMSNSGSVYLLTFTDTAFSGGTLASTIGYGYTGGKNINASTLEASDRFGSFLSLSGNALAIGILQDDGYNNQALDSGAVQIYTFTDSAFSGGTLASTIGYGYTGGKNIDLGTNFIADNSDGFSAVALDGTNLLIGGAQDDAIHLSDSGAVVMISFTDSSFNGGAIKGVAGNGYTGGKNISLDPSTYSEADRYGYAVSFNANRLAVSTIYDDGLNDSVRNSGAVYLYSIPGGDYDSIVFEGLIGYGYTGGKNVDMSAWLNRDDNFGSSLSLDGNRLAVGTHQDDGSNNSGGNTGAVYLFTFSDAAFSGGTLASVIGSGYTGGKNINLTGITTNDQFGYSVSLDGNRLAVGARQDDGSGNTLTDSGAVYLFTFSDAAFSGGSLVGTLGYGYTGGNNINMSGLGSSDYFGYSVSLDGNRLAVGSPQDDGIANTVTNGGAVYLFTFTDSAFSGGTLASTIGYGYTGGKNVDVSSLATNDNLGSSVALDGTVLAIGAQNDQGYNLNTGSSTGAIFLYTFADLNFTNPTYDSAIGYLYTGGKNINITSTYQLGGTISLDSGVLVAGQSGTSDITGSFSNTGRVYIFRDSLSPVSSGSSFSTLSGNTIGITAASITSLLSAGTNVTLQASNDITLASPIFVNNSFGNGGTLTLQAGRSIILNASIITDNGNLNILANENLGTGVVNSQRDTGAAAITMASGTSIDAGTGSVVFRIDAGTGKTYNQAGDMTLGAITAGNFQALSGSERGDIYTNGVITASGTGDAIILDAGANYINNYGAGALVTPAGRWLIYGDHSYYSNLNGLSPAFTYYKCAYGGSCSSAIPGTGNGVLYEYGQHLVTISVNTTRIYGDANPNNAALQSLYSYSGFEGSDSAGVLDVLPTATIAGTSTTTSNAGTTHVITLSGGSDNFYDYYLLPDSTLTVVKRDITASWNAPLTKTYGDINPTVSTSNFTYTGMVNGDTGSAVTASANYTGITTATGAGSYLIGATFSATNYNITNAPTTTLTVGKKDITASWTGTLSRVYGDANPTVTTSNFTYTGMVNGDTNSAVTGSADYLGTTAITSVGTYNVNGTFSSANYNITNTPVTTMSITKRDITATVGNDSRAYGDTNPAWDWSDVTWGNLANGQDGSVLDALTLTAATANAASNAGTTHTIALSGFSDNNYNLTTTTNGTLTITKRDITATVGNDSRAYGDTNPAWDWSDVTWGNLANGQNGSVLDALALTAATANAASNAGTTHTIALSGFSDNNYNLTTTTNGTLTIQKASVTITADNASRAEGAANPSFTYTVSGLKNSEDPSIIQNLLLTTSADALSTPGNYTIFITGGTASNYLITGYTNGTLQVLSNIPSPPAAPPAAPPAQAPIIQLPSSYEGNVTGTNTPAPPALQQQQSVFPSIPTLGQTTPISVQTSTGTETLSGGEKITIMPHTPSEDSYISFSNTLIFFSERLKEFFGLSRKNS